MPAAAYDLHAVTVDPSTGALTDHGSWPNVKLEESEVEELLNGVGGFTWTAGALDSYVATVAPKPYATEVRLDRAGTTIFAGPIVTAESNGTTVTFRAEDLGGYMAVRYIDIAAGRTNYITNPQFESGLTGWTAVGATATADTAQHVLGAQSAKLVSASANQDNYLKQTFNITGTGVGSLITVAAWFRLATAGFLGAAKASFGLWILQKDPTTHAVINPDPDDLVQIDGSVDRDTWVRVKAITRVPVSTNVDVEVRLYSPGGTIWWDAVQAVLMESTAFDNVDQASIAGSLVSFCQTPGNGWSNLGLTTSTPATGITRGRAYQHADHQRLDAALQEYVEMDDGFDWSITPGRVFTTYYPRRGTDRSGTITLTVGGNCEMRRWSVDGHQAASSIVELGSGSGPDREEGTANTGAGTIVGGTTVRQILTPRQSNPPIDTLAATATRELAVLDNPTIWEVEITDRTVATTVGVGDKVTFTSPSGVVGSYLTTTGVYRIVRKRWLPKTDTLAVVLNPAI